MSRSLKAAVKDLTYHFEMGSTDQETPFKVQFRVPPIRYCELMLLFCKLLAVP